VRHVVKQEHRSSRAGHTAELNNLSEGRYITYYSIVELKTKLCVNKEDDEVDTLLSTCDFIRLKSACESRRRC